MSIPTNHGDQDLLPHLQALELRLHEPGVRANAHQLGLLLHDDFTEFGRSGGVHAKADTAGSLATEAAWPRLVADGFALVRLGPDSALLTYRSASVAADGLASRHTLRPSVWLRTGLGWQMRFHQGTPTPPFALAPPLR